jgi:S-adenosylmethionine/arginine decarboxylase-like enzyme
MTHEFTTRGKHIMVDVYRWENKILVEDAMQAAKEAGMNVESFMLIPNTHQIGLVLQESHLTACRLPDGRYFIDVYTCGENDPMVAVQYLLDHMKATSYSIHTLDRGDENGMVLHGEDDQHDEHRAGEQEDRRVQIEPQIACT